ncbi:MAG: hypothetical protein KG003_13880 [Bacteroidetes bacterium]|nr:hypothetical protein [Bacteroidota bacterium]
MNHDSPFLYFLRNFPAWIPLLFLTLTFVGFYFYTNDSAYKEWTGLILSALFTALGMQRQQTASQSANTESGDVIVSAPSESTNLQNIQPGEIENAVENLEEKK